MGSLYLMTTIVDRKIAKKYVDLYNETGKTVLFITLGTGTASSEVMDYLGLDSLEKAVIFSVQEQEGWQETKKLLQKKLQIDAPGGGIAFTVPLSSIGGKKTLQFLLEKEEYRKEEESTLKDTTHELIVVISDQGYVDLIMEAARGAGAYGGTVIHAKGTGMEVAEKFMGVSLAAICKYNRSRFPRPWYFLVLSKMAKVKFSNISALFLLPIYLLEMLRAQARISFSKS